MNNVPKGLRGHLPVLTHPDVIAVPTHVCTDELGPLVPIMSNSPNQWVAKTGMALRVTVGSGVHGLALSGLDDDDHMGVFVEPPEYVIGSKRIEQQIMADAADLVTIDHTLRQFLNVKGD